MSLKIDISFVAPTTVRMSIKIGLIISSNTVKTVCEGLSIGNCFSMSVFKFLKTLPFPCGISDGFILSKNKYKNSYDTLLCGKYNHPSWIQELTPRNFGIPGDALFDRTKSPALSATVFDRPSTRIWSSISIINGDDEFVASEILSHRNPLFDKKS